MRRFADNVLHGQRNMPTTGIALGSLILLGISTSVAAQAVDYANPFSAARDLVPTAQIRQLNPIETVQTITTPVLDRQ